MSEKSVIEVQSEETGQRADKLISEKLSELTRSAVQGLIEKGSITVCGKNIAKNYKVKNGDVIEIEIPEPEILDVKAEEIPLDIVYEDDDLLVVNKPKGMVVHPAHGNYTGTLVNALMHYCKGSLSGINGVIRPGIVHRIDKDTSGLLVVAKNDIAHVSLAEQIKSHTFDRFYEAICCGRFKEEKGTIDAPIGRHPKDRKKMAIVSDGRNAVTHYEVISEYNGFSHVRFRLETGRTHQIRVHTSSKGHPIVGDTVYGARDKLGVEGQCLHAKTISFVHPISRELMSFDSQLPEYFENTLSKLRKV